MITTLPSATATRSDAPTATSAATPIRRHDGLEVPAAGMWPLVVSSSVKRSIARTRYEPLPITAGWLDVADDPSASWLHIQLCDRVIDLTVVDIAADPFELSAWHLAGVAASTDVDARQQPVTMALRYHGVYRRGGQIWVWLSGTAVVGVARSRRKPAERLALDLLFEFGHAGGR